MSSIRVMTFNVFQTTLPDDEIEYFFARFLHFEIVTE